MLLDLVTGAMNEEQKKNNSTGYVPGETVMQVVHMANGKENRVVHKSERKRQRCQHSTYMWGNLSNYK